MKAYIAAPIFRPEQLAVTRRIGQLLGAKGYEFFSPYDESVAIWQGRAPAECSDDERRRVLQQNIDNLHCDLVVAWLRGTGGPFTDQGVVWELGYAYALQVPVVGFLLDEEKADDLNLMLAGTLTAVVQGWIDLEGALVVRRDDGPAALAERYSVEELVGHEVTRL